MHNVGSATFAAALLVFSLDAHAQPFLRGLGPPPKGVVVTNFPNPQNVTGSVTVTNLPAVQDVHVVNAQPPAQCGAPPSFQLVGFTRAVFTGDLGGPFGANQKCQAEFPGSRICDYSEVRSTVIVPSGLAGLAWLNLDGGQTQCQDWTNGVIGGGSGPTRLASNGTLVVPIPGCVPACTPPQPSSPSFCSEQNSIACCAPLP